MGGVLYVETSDSANLTLKQCIFTSCEGFFGGVLYLGFNSPYINIISCRFENNGAYIGADILSSSSLCFSEFSPIDSCTSYTNERSVLCNSAFLSIFTYPCNNAIVSSKFRILIIFFYNFIFYFLFVSLGATLKTILKATAVQSIV
jgi:hypothetical protein